jgi:hypothetical protein
MRFHNTLTNGEPQASTCPVRLGGEKWLENVLEIFSGDAHTGIRNGNRNIVAAGTLWTLTDDYCAPSLVVDLRSVSFGTPLSRDAEAVAVRHGVEGIDQTIEQDLLQLGGVPNDRREIGGQDRRGGHLFAREDRGQQVQQPLHKLVGIDGFQR